jgi:hypothetical protein
MITSFPLKMNLHNARTIRFIPFLFLIAFQCRPDTITSTTCSADGVAASGLTACAVSTPQGGIANANAFFITSNLTSTQFSAAANVTASVNASVQNNVQGPVLAMSDARLFTVLDTAGLDRPGFIEVSATDGSNPGNSGKAETFVNIGPYTINLDLSETFCCSILLPFELGQPFLFDMNTFNVQGTDVQGTGSLNFASSGQTNPNVEIHFLEADRSTVVPLFETSVPEPSAVGLLGIGIGLVFWKLRHRVSAIPSSFITNLEK